LTEENITCTTRFFTLVSGINTDGLWSEIQLLDQSCQLHAVDTVVLLGLLLLCPFLYFCRWLSRS